MALFYKTYGERGPLLVILHGMLGAGGNWHSLARGVFSEEHRVLVPDLRGHGRSPHLRPLTYPEMAADVLDLVGDEPFTVLGHSMGGKVAMRLALDRPEQVSALIVADMSPDRSQSDNDLIIRTLLSVDPGQYDNRKAVEAELEKTIASWTIRQFLLKNLTAGPNGKYQWQPDLEGLSVYYDSLMEPVTAGKPYPGPTLFVRGSRSDYIEAGSLPKLRSLFLNAVLQTIEGAGHWVHAENPDEFARIVSDFLRTID